MITTMLRRTKRAILWRAVLLFALFGIPLLQLTLAQAPESAHDGPVINILLPVMGQRVAGPEFQVVLEIAR